MHWGWKVGIAAITAAILYVGASTIYTLGYFDGGGEVAITLMKPPYYTYDCKNLQGTSEVDIQLPWGTYSFTINCKNNTTV